MSDHMQVLEEVAKQYDSVNDFDYHLIRYTYRDIRPYIRGPRVLELGCSSGVMTRLLAADFPDLNVVDGSVRYLDDVRPTVPATVSFHHALFENFQPPGRFDDLILASALEHLPDPLALLPRLRDWIAPGGRLHVVVPNALSLHRLVGVHLGMLEHPAAFTERDRMLDHRRVYDTDLLRTHLQSSGWSVEKAGGIFLKPLSNAQMEQFAPAQLEAFYKVGQEMPRQCAMLYAFAIRSDS